jgi:2-oxo-4-hydroxy-4-carboxy-5-ureidoimidazoline decarboxylase
LINFPNRNGFVTKFGHLFEHSPWVVERAWEMAPFADEDALHAAMMRVVDEAGTEAQLALIRAHPELAARTALTPESSAEQAGAGLKHLTAAEFDRFAALNAAYREKFGFPFIICVRLQTKASIFAAFEQRLQNDAAEEQARALAQIGLITRLRLQDMGATA